MLFNNYLDSSSGFLAYLPMQVCFPRFVEPAAPTRAILEILEILESANENEMTQISVKARFNFRS